MITPLYRDRMRVMFRRFSTILLVLSLLIALFPAPSDGEEIGTPVYQSITENTTWTKDGSPYLLKNIITISRYATLTIEPGVKVIGSGGMYLEVNGKLSATGGTTTEERILFEDVYINGTNFPESLLHIENANLSRANGGLLISSFGYGVSLKNNVFENGLLSLGAPITQEQVIAQNVFQNNARLQVGLGKYLTTVKNNSFLNRGGDSRPDLEIQCYSYRSCSSPNIEINENNFFGGNRIYVTKSGDRDYSYHLSNNYWGTTNVALINSWLGNRSMYSIDSIAYKPFVNGHPMGELENPLVETVGDNQTFVKGATDAFSLVEIWGDETKLGEGFSDDVGSFTVPIPIQRSLTKLRIIVTDSFGRRSEITQTVVDVTAPTELKIHPLQDDLKQMTGVTEPFALVKITHEGIQVGSTSADSSGSFTYEVDELKAGTIFAFQAMDTAGNKGEIVTATVQDGTPPAQPSVNQEITDQLIQFDGKAEPNSIITLFANSIKIAETKTNSYGNYYFYLPKSLKAGTSIVLISTDQEGNQRIPLQLVVKDTTPPNLFLYPMKDHYVSIYGVTEPGSTITISKNGMVIGEGSSAKDGEFAITVTKQSTGTKLTVESMDLSGNINTKEVTVEDGTPPIPPTVSKITDQSVIISGKTEPYATVHSTTGQLVLGKVVADKNGNFTIPVFKQKAGTVIEIKASDAAGNVSNGSKVTVIDATAPSVPIVNTVSNKSTSLSGIAEANSSVLISIAGKTYTGKANSVGSYMVTIPTQNSSTTISVVAKDSTGNTSQAKVVTVARLAPNIPVVNPVNNKVSSITGKTEKYAIVSVKLGTKIYSVKADIYGNYKVGIFVQNHGTSFSITAKDSKGNISSTRTGAVIRVAPNIPVVNAIRTYSTSVTGTTEKYAVVTAKIGTRFYSSKADAYGKFKITIPKQRNGTLLSVYVKDSSNQVSISRSIKVY